MTETLTAMSAETLGVLIEDRVTTALLDERFHIPTTRYSYDDGLSSAATEAEARRNNGDEPLDELHTFQVCATCGPAEVLLRDDYEVSQWPCPTERDRRRRSNAQGVQR